MISRLKQERRFTDTRLASHKDRCTWNDSATKHSIELTEADCAAVRRVEPFTRCANDYDGRFPTLWAGGILFTQSLLLSALWTEPHPSR
jgi:hypothetical protein